MKDNVASKVCQGAAKPQGIDIVAGIHSRHGRKSWEVAHMPCPCEDLGYRKKREEFHHEQREKDFDALVGCYQRYRCKDAFQVLGSTCAPVIEKLAGKWSSIPGWTPGDIRGLCNVEMLGCIDNYEPARAAQGKVSFLSFVKQKCLWRIIDTWRKETERTVIVVDGGGYDDDALGVSEIDRTQELLEVEEAISAYVQCFLRMPEHWQKVFFLRVFGVEYEIIGQHTGYRVEQLHGFTHRAVASLKRCLNVKGIDNEYIDTIFDISHVDYTIVPEELSDEDD